MQFSKEQQLKMYENLVYARVFGEKVIEYILGGRLYGSVHPTLGQEAISAGILCADEFSPCTIYKQGTHRQQPIIAKIIGEDPFLAEIMNKGSGMLHGCSGEFHLVSLKDKLLPMSGILGSAPLSSTGFAWTLKQDKRKDTIVLSCFGDGAMSEGSVYEAMNMASIFKLPILYVLENNQVAMTTPACEESPVADLAVRAVSAGMQGVTIDGNDIEAVIEALLAGIEKAANNEPNLVELKTWRWQGHHVGEKQELYRDTGFLKNLDALDPVKRFEKKLLERGYADEALFSKLRAEQDVFLSAAFEKASALEAPDRETVLDYNAMYSNNAGAPL